MTLPIVVVSENRARTAPYIEALRAAGAEPAEILTVTPRDKPAPDLEGLAAAASGLLICGGEDLEPWRYGEEAIAGINLELCPALDALEWKLLASAQERRTPVWGICRGSQTINAFLGGTLWQDLPNQNPSNVQHNVPQPHDAMAHAVEITQDDEGLGLRLGSERFAVNSRHHQAIRRLGKDLVAVARAPDGVIEAITLSTSSSWWVRGVQWHPEDLADRSLDARLWREFVAATHRLHDTNLRRRAG